MREKLILKLMDKFEFDKKVIIENLKNVMDTIVLEAKDGYNKITLMIKIERDYDTKRGNKERK